MLTQAQLVKIVLKLVKLRLKDRTHFLLAVKRLAAELKHPSPPNWRLLQSYQKLLQSGKLKRSPIVEQYLRKRAVRTLSGVAVVAVFTKAYPCPGKCVYCPTQREVPKSYLSNEPGIMRAITNHYDPYLQVRNRLKALAANGHPIDKIELIVMGGTWSYLPEYYQRWFIQRCYQACNEMGKSASKKLPALRFLQVKNQKVKHRMVGLTLETRPDYITPAEIERMREYGCTRVELGVQNISDRILIKNIRGHGVKEIVLATRLLKEAGFKICYHLMPNLPGATVQSDLKMFKTIFSDPRFQPDMIKIYPCVVTKGSVLYQWYLQGKYQTYTDEQLIKLLIKIKKIIPNYVRINRLYRDIPANSIVAGCKMSNLRQVLENKVKCKCIRCREVGHQKNFQPKADPPRAEKLRLKTNSYQASSGKEYFLQFVDSKNNLYAFLRLRLNNQKTKMIFPELQNAAIIREIHTYGQLVPVAQAGKVQHTGLGKKLMVAAEKIACQQGFAKIAVIAGVGVREYYQKLGYNLEGSYMVKTL